MPQNHVVLIVALTLLVYVVIFKQQREHMVFGETAKQVGGGVGRWGGTLAAGLLPFESATLAFPAMSAGVALAGTTGAAAIVPAVAGLIVASAIAGAAGGYIGEKAGERIGEHVPDFVMPPFVGWGSPPKFFG
jgi:hypothetical protein